MWHTNEHESALESVTSPFKSEIWENDGTRLWHTTFECIMQKDIWLSYHSSSNIEALCCAFFPFAGCCNWINIYGAHFLGLTAIKYWIAKCLLPMAKGWMVIIYLIHFIGNICVVLWYLSIISKRFLFAVKYKLYAQLSATVLLYQIQLDNNVLARSLFMQTVYFLLYSTRDFVPSSVL